ncbi:hypothetical protein Bhyg_16760 [Pseudolycoriella hygida]|uniref:Uncharacterized protein n=1 Tax=Pseudolycoriella hygida TaxID=35572 RepID=A0A9Q0RV47_9DIPT|nr:hypothetical protein Bhyg_16760 [Pseudolycoriella hygida]
MPGRPCQVFKTDKQTFPSLYIFGLKRTVFLPFILLHTYLNRFLSTSTRQELGKNAAINPRILEEVHWSRRYRVYLLQTSGACELIHLRMMSENTQTIQNKMHSTHFDNHSSENNSIIRGQWRTIQQLTEYFKRGSNSLPSPSPVTPSTRRSKHWARILSRNSTSEYAGNRRNKPNAASECCGTDKFNGNLVDESTPLDIRIKLTNLSEMHGVASETPELCSIANTCDMVISPFITRSGLDKWIKLFTSAVVRVFIMQFQIDLNLNRNVGRNDGWLLNGACNGSRFCSVDSCLTSSVIRSVSLRSSVILASCFVDKFGTKTFNFFSSSKKNSGRIATLGVPPTTFSNEQHASRNPGYSAAESMTDFRSCSLLGLNVATLKHLCNMRNQPKLVLAVDSSSLGRRSFGEFFENTVVPSTDI